jgi:hypothetical protein
MESLCGTPLRIVLGWFIVVLGLQKLAVISAGPDSAGRPK